MEGRKGGREEGRVKGGGKRRGREVGRRGGKRGGKRGRKAGGREGREEGREGHRRGGNILWHQEGYHVCGVFVLERDQRSVLPVIVSSGRGGTGRGWGMEGRRNKGTHLEGIQVGCRIKPRMGM
jgi:hypothetical protein